MRMGAGVRISKPRNGGVMQTRFVASSKNSRPRRGRGMTWTGGESGYSRRHLPALQRLGVDDAGERLSEIRMAERISDAERLLQDDPLRGEDHLGELPIATRSTNDGAGKAGRPRRARKGAR